MATFPYPPDWSDPPSESIEYPTQILETYDQHEQRIQLRAIPIHRWEYAPDPTQHRLMIDSMRGLLGSGSAGMVYAPMWHRAATANLAISVGDSSIWVTTEGRGFKSGDYCYVWSPGKGLSTYQVSTVLSSAITIVGTTGYSYPVGALVAPAPLAWIDLESNDFSGIVPACAPGRVRFRAAVDTRQSLSWTQTTNGRPLWTARPNMVEPPRFSLKQGGYDLVSTPGILTRRVRQAYPQTSRTLHWTTSSISEITQWMKLIETIKGRLVPFYCPTWLDDWESTTAGQGRNQVCAMTYSGVFTSGVYTGWTKVTNALNMWLPAVRLASDAVTISYPTLTSAEVSLDLVDLRWES